MGCPLRLTVEPRSQVWKQIPEDHHGACTSEKGVFRMKEAEWSGRSHESLENYAAASPSQLGFGEFSSTQELQEKWPLHGKVTLRWRRGKPESPLKMLRLLEIFFTKTGASANTGGRFGGDGREEMAQRGCRRGADDRAWHLESAWRITGRWGSWNDGGLGCWFLSGQFICSSLCWQSRFSLRCKWHF